jgi:outer membrane protein TolC
VGKDAVQNSPTPRVPCFRGPARALGKHGGWDGPRKHATLALLLALLAAVCGCNSSLPELSRNIIPPEQRTLAYQDPAPLPAARIPAMDPPRTVSDPRPDEEEWRLSLDDAIRIALQNSNVVRTLAGVTAVASGQTIYDTAIVNTTIDQAQARFDPVLTENAEWSRTNSPFGVPDPRDPTATVITSTPTDAFHNDLGVKKTNVLGGQWALDATETSTREPGQVLPLNPEEQRAVTLSYTQPFLQGAGFRVNAAPIVIARINTEQSYFQYKDAVQEMVRGVIEAYWTLVQAEVDAWARRTQVEDAAKAYELARAKHQIGPAAPGQTAPLLASNEYQARVTYDQLKAALIASEANVLDREAALRNILGLPPEDCRRIVPTSLPTSRRLRPVWQKIVQLAEERRPDIIELKLIVEADKQRLVLAEDQALPQLNATALYRWNGLSGEMPNGREISTHAGQFTDWTVGVNFSVPLGLRQGRAAVRQQRLLIARDRDNVSQGLHAALHDLAAASRELDSAFEQYLALKETREAALVNLQFQKAAFRTGNVNYLNYLQALTDWGNAVSAEALQLTAYNVDLAVVERQTGTILETHGLIFAEERFRAAGPIPFCPRSYPAALVPTGEPQRYPDSGAPAENALEPQEPETQPNPRPPPEELPPPRKAQ